MKIEEHVPLSSLTTFRTGGPARFLVTIESKDEVSEAVLFARTKNLSLIPLGSGSNILPPDSGLDAVVARYLPAARAATVEDGYALVAAEAGGSWDDLVAHAVEKGWWGIENLSAIPGTVGAAVVQNIGAYGAAVETVTKEVEAYDTKENHFVTLTRAECAFGYRTSIFKQNADRYFITSVTLALPLSGEPNMSYADMRAYFTDAVSQLTLKELREAVIAIRKKKFPPLSELGTAGSFFLNPIFTPETVRTIREKFPEMPVYELPEGGIKVPLAWIFDQILRAKGRRVGGAVVWDKQPLVIVSESTATTDDVVRLAKSIVEDFFKVTGITIMPEVRLFNEEKKLFENNFKK